MVSKQDTILAHIRSLKPGTSISIRSLAGQLGISEGTAYKAIKTAETEGLVITKEKVGTIRIGNQRPGLTLGELSVRLGLRVLVGSGLSERDITHILPATGSLEQFSSALSDASRETLCVCGDRPDVIQEAVARGAHLLLCDATLLPERLVAEAQTRDSCVLQSGLSCQTLFTALTHAFQEIPRNSEGISVGNWMSPPHYLYHNDYISDWYRMYQTDFSNIMNQPVVNDDLTLCGYLPVDRGFSAQISGKISQVYVEGDVPCIVEEGDSMTSVMEQMLTARSNYAFVVRDGKLSGTVSPADLIRYSMYSRNIGAGFSQYANAMEPMDRSEDGRHMVFTLRLADMVRETDSASFLLFPCMLNVAKMHFKAVFGVASSAESGSFYTVDERRLGGEIMLGSDIKKIRDGSCFIEGEMYDDISRYASATFVLYASQAEKEG